MSRQKIIISPPKAMIFPFEKPLEHFVFGGETLLARLRRQLAEFDIETSIEASIPKESKPSELRIEANFVASDHFWKLFSQGKLPSEIERTLNPTLTVLNSPIQTEIIPFVSRPGVHKQEVLLTIDLGLPRAIYGGEKYVCRFPSIFYQPIRNWIDLIKASSLIAREETSRSILKFRPWLGMKLLDKVIQNPTLSAKFNKVGHHSRIHPTARLEGCQIGDHVEIGPYCYLRASVIGNHVTIREHSSIKASVIGSGSFLMPVDLFNTYLGEGCSIFTSILHNSCFGDSCFVGGGSGFSDFNAMASSIHVSSTQEIENVNEPFLGSAIGEGSFIGAGLIFQSGQAIPPRTKILNGEMISKISSAPGKIYVTQNGRLTSLPQSFLRKGDLHV
jgi:acetyltransferase-like isoleucine patch superfamily enzyme